MISDLSTLQAATENTDLKLKIFEQISQCAPAHAILGSNTSSISITKIAAATDRPEQVGQWEHITGQGV